MGNQPITIAPVTEAEIPAIVDLIMAQQTHQLMRDPRLRNVARDQIENMLKTQINSTAFVALNRDSRVRGYAQPSVWELKETSILQSFLTARNGIVQQLTLPDPVEEDAEEVATTLLTALDTFWQNAATTGDLIRWPSTDVWFTSTLTNRNFQLDSCCALRQLSPFFASRPIPTPRQRIRAAKPDDEEALIGLFQDELHFHEQYTPFVRSNPQVLDAFRRMLHSTWDGMKLEDGAPLVLVVEQDGVVIAMAENTLLEVSPDDEPGFTPAGRYWCIDNVSVQRQFQGRGIGRLLVQAIEDTRTSLHLALDGYILWFNPDNPNAARFWPRLGFQPLWTTYQRLHP
jgi:GNAT superfamily N-acetyltransferase